MASENVFATQVALGTIGAGLLNLLKQSKFVTAINDKSSVLNHAVLAVTSFAGSLGVHAAWSSSSHSLTITGLTLSTVLGGAWLWFKQWSIQYLVHRGAFGAIGVSSPAGMPNPLAGQLGGSPQFQGGQPKP